MGLYLDFARKAFRQQFVYKTNMLFRVFGEFALLFIVISAWQALYHQRDEVSGIRLDEMITYMILGQVLTMFTRSFTMRRIAERLSEGTIGNDFIRPVNFKYYMIAEDVGENSFATIFSTLPAVLFGMWFWGIQLPGNPAYGCLFLLSLVGGFLLIQQLNYTIGLLAFWFKTEFFVDWLFRAFQLVFSGTMVPFWFYPPALRLVSECFPWYLVTFAPLSIYLEKCSLAEGVQYVGLQLVWLVVLLGVERLLWRQAQQKIEIYGG